MRLRAYGFGLKVWGLGFRVEGFFRLALKGFGIWGVLGSDGVWGFGVYRGLYDSGSRARDASGLTPQGSGHL